MYPTPPAICSASSAVRHSASLASTFEIAASTAVSSNPLSASPATRFTTLSTA